MTYIDEISSALVRVLTHACDGPPHRFAGYAANADFWIGEARHCLDVIAGYDERFAAMQAATAAHDTSGEHDWPVDPRVTRSTKLGDRRVARQQVTEVARRFLRRCEKMEALGQEQVIALCNRLTISYPP